MNESKKTYLLVVALMFLAVLMGVTGGVYFTRPGPENPQYTVSITVRDRHDVEVSEDWFYVPSDKITKCEFVAPIPYIRDKQGTIVFEVTNSKADVLKGIGLDGDHVSFKQYTAAAPFLTSPEVYENRDEWAVETRTEEEQQ